MMIRGIDEKPYISIEHHASHIYSSRQEIMREQIKAMDLDWYESQPLDKLQELCFESFRNNYQASFIKKEKNL